MSREGGLYLLPRLAEALVRGGATHTWADIVALCEAGRAKLWWDDDERAAIVTEMLDFPQMRAVNFWLVAGELGPTIALRAKIEADARAQGARLAIAVGRAGWTRILPELGYQMVGTAFRKELQP
jgi:hypothetical protein